MRLAEQQDGNGFEVPSVALKVAHLPHGVAVTVLRSLGRLIKYHTNRHPVA